MKKNDIFLIAGIVVIAVAVLFLVRKNQAVSDPDQVIVYVNGVEKERFPLHEDRLVEIETEDGGTNLLQIKDGEAEIVEANCTDHICEKQGRISKNGDMIVCLPHGVLVQIDSETERTSDTTVK